MERRAPFVLAGILFLLGISVGQDDVIRTKGQGPPAFTPGRVLTSADLARIRSSVALPPPQERSTLASYSRLPLSFEPNQGQAGSAVKYLARGGQFNVFLTQDEVVFGFARRHNRRQLLLDTEESPAVELPELSSLELRLVGADPSLRVSGMEELPGKANYLVGRERSQWRASGGPSGSQLTGARCGRKLRLAGAGGVAQFEVEPAGFGACSGWAAGCVCRGFCGWFCWPLSPEDEAGFWATIIAARAIPHQRTASIRIAHL